MVNCPKCGKPVSGRAMVCGYCGESLVRDYFSKKSGPEIKGPARSAITVGAAIVGSLGAAAVLAALACFLAPLFGEHPPVLTGGWWAQALLLALLPSVHLMQQLMMRGMRFSLAFDGCWLFASVCALGFLLQGWIAFGDGLLGGSEMAFYLAAAGCALVAAASGAGIAGFPKQEQGVGK